MPLPVVHADAVQDSVPAATVQAVPMSLPEL